MGKLYVVPTPVGNLEDMTFRAVKVLKEVDLILAEDTRTSGILLKHFEIKNAMQSHHKFNEHKEESNNPDGKEYCSDPVKTACSGRWDRNLWTEKRAQRLQNPGRAFP